MKNTTDTTPPKTAAAPGSAPTEAGFYWWRSTAHPEWVVVQLYHAMTELAVNMMAGTRPSPLTDWLMWHKESEWNGPIPPPPKEICPCAPRAAKPYHL